MEGVGTSRGFLIVSFFSEKPEVRSLTESEDGKQKLVEVGGEKL